jgi:hypothetical protein
MSEQEKNNEEVDEDFGDALASLVGALAKEMKENPVTIEDDFEFPMEISEIDKSKACYSPMSLTGTKAGALVKIRPCGDEYENKTYLGIYVGEIAISTNIGLFEKTKKLSIMFNRNPAIFVPELKKVIFGCESFWGEIKSEEELKDITDDDIENVWYIQLLKELGKDGLATGTEEDRDNS